MTGKFAPFENETDSIQMGGPDGISIENRTDRISLYGSLDITRDKQGLALATALQDILAKAIRQLAADPDLPDTISPPAAPGQTDNPFRR